MTKVTAHDMTLYSSYGGCLKSRNNMGATWHIRNEHILDHMFRPEELTDLTEQAISLEALDVSLPNLNFESDGKEIMAHDQEHRISLQKLDGKLREKKKLYRTAESKLRDEIEEMGQTNPNSSVFKNWVTYAIGILGITKIIVIITAYCKFKGASSLLVLICLFSTACGKTIIHGTKPGTEIEVVDTTERNETNNDGSNWYDVHIQVLNHTAFLPTVMSTLTILTLMAIVYQIYKLRKNHNKLEIKVYLLFDDSGNETVQILWRTFPLAVFAWSAENYFSEHTITWKRLRPIFWCRWSSLECRNCSRENMKLLLPEQIKISHWQAYNLQRILKVSHQVSLVLVDAEGKRQTIKVDMKKKRDRTEDENLKQINNIWQFTQENQPGQPTAPLEHDNLASNLASRRDDEERRVLFGKIYYAE